MSEMTYDDAVAALQGNQAHQEAPPAPEPAPATDASPQGEETGTTEAAATDSFTDLDPSQLSPAEQKRYSEMQADYTRKTTAIAERAKQFDAIGDLDRAQQALQFVEALETDPNFVVSVHQQLSQALQEAGLSPAQADAAAAQELEGSLGNGQDDFGDESDSPLAKQLQELQAWKAETEAKETERMLAGQIQAQEMQIRQDNPSWTEDDIGSVYEMAFAYGGDLNAAAKSYAALNQRVIETYVNKKESVQSTSADPGSGFASAPPEGFGSDLDAAHRAAEEHLRNVLAG